MEDVFTYIALRYRLSEQKLRQTPCVLSRLVKVPYSTCESHFMVPILTSYLGHKRDIPYYRPFVLRTEFLTSLLIVTLILIALIEYACQVVPGHDGFGDLPSTIMNESRQSLKLSSPWKSNQNSKFICLFFDTSHLS
jgi:hypothetical protein